MIVALPRAHTSRAGIDLTGELWAVFPILNTCAAPARPICNLSSIGYVQWCHSLQVAKWRMCWNDGMASLRRRPSDDDELSAIQKLFVCQPCVSVGWGGGGPLIVFRQIGRCSTIDQFNRLHLASHNRPAHFHTSITLQTLHKYQ